MDLISRKSVAEKMAQRRDYVGRPSDPDCIIADEPSVPAVPLEPLCEWLAGYADPPKYAMKIIPESGECLINARAKAWEHHFRNMMECGLMEEGRHDTE